MKTIAAIIRSYLAFAHNLSRYLNQEQRSLFRVKLPPVTTSLTTQR